MITPTLRDQAIDAVKQAVNALGMWLPPAGREAAADAALALVDAAPTGQSALGLIRASITAHEAKADEAHDAGHPHLGAEHNAIAAGLRIAEAHILAALEPSTETPNA